MLPGIILICLLILPAAGASLVSDCRGDLFCTPQQECPLSPANPYSSGLVSSHYFAEALKTAQGGSDPAGSVSLPGPSSVGTISAWVNQNSMQGNANGLVSTIEYHQKVTASGQIQGFSFSAGWVS